MIYILFLIALFIIFIFIAFYIPEYDFGKQGNKEENIEQFVITDKEMSSTCYDKIVKRGSMYYLFQTTQPLEEKINPLVFTSLDDYGNYVRKSSLIVGYDCPMIEYTGKDNKYIHPDERYQQTNDEDLIQPIVNNNEIEEQDYDEYGTPIVKPYATNDILNLNDYEYNLVVNKQSTLDKQRKDRKIKDLHNTTKISNVSYYNKDYDNKVSKLIGEPNKQYAKSNLLLTPQQQILEEQRISNNDSIPEYNALVEDDPEFIKQMILEKNPKYGDVKIERTGVNQYRVIEITPRREKELPEDVRNNRPDELELINEDLRTYGNSPADPNSNGLKYLTKHKNNFTDALERMFAPSIPRDIWYQHGNK